MNTRFAYFGKSERGSAGLRRTRDAFLCCLLSASIGGCGPGPAALTDDEQALIAELGFDEPLMSRVKAAGDSLEHLISVNLDYEPAPAPGLVLITPPGQGRQVLSEVRAELADSPYSAYLYDEAFGYADDKLAIVRSTDPYVYLAIVRIDGINYDIDHEQVLARYRLWDDKFGLALRGAGQSWLEAEFLRPPTDWMAFADEVYAFCPDIVDQGTGDVDRLATEMRAANTLYLWWD